MASKFTPNDKLKTLLLLNAIPLCFSINVVVGRGLREAVEPSTLAFYRWAIASVILLFLSGRVIWRYRAKLAKVLDLLFLLGFLGMYVCGALFYEALQHTKAVNGALIYMVSPAIIILLEVIFRGMRLNVTRIMGVLCAMAGVVMVLLMGNDAGFEWQKGDAYCVLASFCWALYSYTLKTERLSEFPTLVLFAAIALAGTVILFPFFLWENGPALTVHFSYETWFGIGLVATIASVLSFGCYQKGVALVGASTTSIYLYLLPVYAVIMAYMFLDESISYAHVIGFVFIAGGLYFATQLPENSGK